LSHSQETTTEGRGIPDGLESGPLELIAVLLSPIHGAHHQKTIGHRIDLIRGLDDGASG
jgi:hypothetical protein